MHGMIEIFSVGVQIIAVGQEVIHIGLRLFNERGIVQEIGQRDQPFIIIIQILIP